MSNAVFILVLAAGGAMVLWKFSWQSGWRELARHYRAHSSWRGRSYHLASAKVGRIWYRSCLVLSTGAEGLGMWNVPPFGLFEPELLIPWDDLTARERAGVFGGVVFHSRHVPNVEILLWRRLGRAIAAKGGLSLAEERADGACRPTRA